MQYLELHKLKRALDGYDEYFINHSHLFLKYEEYDDRLKRLEEEKV
jgi:hypothetical protein